MKTLNQNETIAKILRGEIPDGSVSTIDGMVIIRDEITQIYMNLLSGVLFSTIDANATDELVKGRLEFFDRVMETINRDRVGRLFKLLEDVNTIIAEYQQDLSLWPNAKMKNNVCSFISDFWIWTPEQRDSLLVLEESADPKEAVEPAKEPVKKAAPKRTTKKATTVK